MISCAIEFSVSLMNPETFRSALYYNPFHARVTIKSSRLVGFCAGCATQPCRRSLKPPRAVTYARAARPAAVLN